MSVIEVRNLSKEFRSGFFFRCTKALDNISLEIKEGEIFGYLGPNGAGKTTTLKIMVGLLFPTTGVVELLGKSPLNIEVKEKIGFLPENPHFYNYLTAHEYLELCLNLFDIKERNVKSRIEGLLKLVELKDVQNIQCRKFSKGMLQRLGIAQVLVNDPQILILDEPLSGLDPLGRKQIRDLIVDLRDKGKTIFLSSHIISDLEMLCDRVAIIIKGKIRNIGSLADLLADKVRYIEIIAENLSEESKDKIRTIADEVISFDKKISVRVHKEDDVDKIIDLIRKQNYRIFSINPVRSSLEDLLIEELNFKS